MKCAFFGLGGLVAQALKPKEVPPPPPPPKYEYLLCPDMTRPNAQAELVTLTVVITKKTLLQRGFGINSNSGLLALTQERYEDLRPEYKAHFSKMEDAND